MSETTGETWDLAPGVLFAPQEKVPQVYEGKDFNVLAAKKGGYHVYLPHSCDEWDIAGDAPDWPSSNGSVSKADAITALQAFLTDGAAALAALKAAPDSEPEPQPEPVQADPTLPAWEMGDTVSMYVTREVDGELVTTHHARPITEAERASRTFMVDP
jgi:hypothetical protein